MTKRRFCFTFFLLICFSLPLTATAQTVDIPDPNLRAIIANELGKTSRATITTADMARFTTLRVANASIRDLTGLEHATNLRVLNLGAVRGATGYTNSNSIQDISPLAGLNKLTDLRLERNSIWDISPLEGLTNLETLFLWDNLILDISPLEKLTSLTALDLSFNFISDISSLSGLTDLTLLGLQNNFISDLSLLVANTGLGKGDRVFATGNPFSYSSLHTHIPTLQSRGVDVSFDSRTPVLQKISGVVTASSDSTLIVEVRDTENYPFEGVPVTFTVTSGGGTLSVTNTTTDENGRAESILTPGTDGANSVEVSAAGAAQTVTFNQVTASVVNIPDPNLRAAITTTLGKTSGAAITTVDMETLTELWAPNADITNLTGLDAVTNLRNLHLGGESVGGVWVNSNSISDISPVAGSTNLKYLYLDRNSISDISPLAQLTNLEELNLLGNSISDISPVAGLNQLTILSFAGNSISDISPLTGLNNLTDLYLNGNSISDISPLAGSTNLIRLELWDNLISDISPVAGLTQLARLILDNNSISDISPVAGLNNLIFLTLSENSISDVSPVAGLNNLIFLRLDDNSISDISPLVENMGLVGRGDQVDLRGNPLNSTSINTHIPALQSRGVTVEFDAVVAEPVNIPDPNLRAKIEEALGKASGDTVTTVDMEALTKLEASNANITDLTGLEAATNLRELNLGAVEAEGGFINSNSISDISHLAGLTQLRTLSLGNNSISDISHLAGLTNLRELYLYNNSISGISHLAGLTQLTVLSLYNSSISDISHLEGLTNLRSLNLGSNSISGISHLARLTNMGSLTLDHNSIADISPLAELTQLRFLGLSENSISDISPLAELTQLTSLGLGRNNISDISPLAGLTNLTSLRIENNSISDLSPLVANAGLGSGDTTNVSENPLSPVSINTHIPALRNRGVEVRADNLKPTISEYTLSIPAGYSLIHVPLKVTEVDGVAQTITSIGDLYDALGGANAVKLLLTLDSQTQEWFVYFGSLAKDTPADRELTDDTGIIVEMKVPKQVRLTGNPLGTNGSSAIALNPSYNLVGLPLRD